MTTSQAKSPSTPEAIGDQLQSGGPCRPLSLVWDSPFGSSVFASRFFGVSGRELAGKSIDAAEFTYGHSIFENTRKDCHEHFVPSSFESCECFVHTRSIHRYWIRS
jgi:hypothetical protein